MDSPFTKASNERTGKIKGNPQHSDQQNIIHILIFLLNRQGCLTSEDMLWKLDALQSFIKDLHWPDEVFGEHLEHRLKQMASDMIEACSSR